VADGKEEIRRFMAAKRQNRSTGGKAMVYNPQTKKYEVVQQGVADRLPQVTREDLQAFGVVVRGGRPPAAMDCE
jgi:hypothetical protein